MINKMNKFIKLLIIINGMIIPTFILFAVVQVFQPFKNKKKEEVGIIAKPEKQEEKIEILNQTLNYSDPISIVNSTNYYLPIYVQTELEQKNEYSFKSHGGDTKDLVNVIFLNQNYKTLKTLLDKEAYIKSIHLPREKYFQTDEIKKAKHIIYQISFEDTNNDGLLNIFDNSNLYVSGLNGDNLKQITFNKQISSFEFFNKFSQILIKYKSSSNSSDLEKFEIYDLIKNEFKPVESLNKAIENIENRLLK